MREMFEFLKLLNKPFYVLSGSSYLKNSGIMTHPLYKGAIAIEKKNELFRYVLDDIDSTSEKILLCQYHDLLINFLLKQIYNISEKFENIIYFLPNNNFTNELFFISINKEGMGKIKDFVCSLEKIRN